MIFPRESSNKESKQKMNTQFLTTDGQQHARSQLEYLRTVKRAEVASYLREAVEAGDVIRNAAFEEARLEQARLEARIAELEHLLARAQVIDLDSQPSCSVLSQRWHRINSESLAMLLVRGQRAPLSRAGFIRLP
jgi:protocatechuate 3,4-dioxygenase beta subunit